ncbi:DUF7350 domain-containing protein [Natronococcus occultus]|uniref:DUF7350 domain-containing protein n=1 Tax=Natronococcus occultus SP4 TaxID=694430 RepID=L0JYU8_9EURY|nr:hypothetical protein [Natronococcus occultus]AGB37475.1 hypothetical protein Natoc_1670 [Natronococcus occultus SP4]
MKQERHDTRRTIDRRTLVRRTGALAGAVALAGCTGTDGDDDETDDENGADDDVEAVPEIIEVEDPPEAVYVPTHREQMRMLEPIEDGDVAIAPMLSYPHPFWIVAGGDEDSVERVDPAEGHGVHMMFTAWDRETGTVLPVDEGAELRVFRDGERIGSPLSPWTMLSQEMGFHFGDNVSLPGDGSYAVEIDLPALSTRRTGALEDRLTEAVSARFEFEYDEAFREAVVGGVEYLDEELWGERGALEPMEHGDHDHHGDEDDHEADHGHDDHEHGEDDHDHDDHEHDEDDHAHHEVPYSQLPPVEEYPGTLLREDGADETEPGDDADLPRSGDAAVVATLLEPDSRLAGHERYLLVSPRTPYNRVPLADATLAATVEREDGSAADTVLEQTLDGEYGLHYGADVAADPGDDVTVSFESPPQVARHQGYETAFLEMEPLELTVPEETE